MRSTPRRRRDDHGDGDGDGDGETTADGVPWRVPGRGPSSSRAVTLATWAGVGSHIRE